MERKGVSKTAVLGIVFFILLLTTGGLLLANYLISRTSSPVVSKQAVSISPISSNEPGFNAQIISQINGFVIKPGSINTDLLGKMIRSFNLNSDNNTWYDFGSGKNVPAKEVVFSFLSIEGASILQTNQKAETVDGPDGVIRIISSTYDTLKQEIGFQIYYKKSFLDALTPDGVASEWTTAIFRTLSLSSNPNSFKKDSKSFATLLNSIVGQQKLLEVIK